MIKCDKCRKEFGSLRAFQFHDCRPAKMTFDQMRESRKQITVYQYDENVDAQIEVLNGAFRPHLGSIYPGGDFDSLERAELWLYEEMQR